MHNTPETPQLPWESAKYKVVGVKAWDDNPLIAALHELQSKQEIAQWLHRYPVIEATELSLAAPIRAQLASELKSSLYIPLPVHLDIAHQFTRMLREGYLARNPVKHSYWTDSDSETSAAGFSIMGMPGIGKTTTIKRILNFQPQVIPHGYFQSRHFNLEQLVWVFADIPSSCTVKGMIQNLFSQIDSVTGQQYSKECAKHTVSELVTDMHKIIRAHAIGAIVLDEIHRLRRDALRQDNELSEFLVELSNSWKVPIMKIGTFAASEILCREFHALRRCVGQGGLIWDRMTFGRDWHFFAETLWNFQYSRNPAKFSDEFSAVLYHETQGITFFAVQLFAETQICCIENNDAALTPKLMHTVWLRKFASVEPVMEALRTGNPGDVSLMPDVFPTNIKSLLKRGFSYSNGGDASSFCTNRQPPASLIKDILTPVVEKRPHARSCENNEHPPTVSKDGSPKQEKLVPASSPRRKRERRAISLGGLVAAVAAGHKQNLGAYQSLAEAGFVRNGSEFLS